MVGFGGTWLNFQMNLYVEEPHNPKILPSFMGIVRRLKDEDLNFLTKPENPLFLVRSEAVQRS
jgi:hypothetical protein